MVRLDMKILLTVGFRAKWELFLIIRRKICPALCVFEILFLAMIAMRLFP